MEIGDATVRFFSCFTSRGFSGRFVDVYPTPGKNDVSFWREGTENSVSLEAEYLSSGAQPHYLSFSLSSLFATSGAKTGKVSRSDL